jgi:hypothetical protein
MLLSGENGQANWSLERSFSRREGETLAGFGEPVCKIKKKRELLDFFSRFF